MSKTITMRVDDDVYEMVRMAAHGARRTISNFLECAAISYLTQDTTVSDSEMKEILDDKTLQKDLKAAQNDIRNGRYTFVD